MLFEAPLLPGVLISRYKRFLAEGLDEEEVIATGDPLALEVVKVAHGKQ